MSERRIWQGLALFTVAIYGGLAWVWFGQLVPEAGGLTPFDGRFMGYTVDEARAYVRALSVAGREIYFNDVRLLDTVFPVALTATLAMPLLRLAKGVWRAQAVVPLGYLVADLTENARVAAILADSAPTDQMIIAASGATVVKYGFLIVSAIALAATYVTVKQP